MKNFKLRKFYHILFVLTANVVMGQWSIMENTQVLPGSAVKSQIRFDRNLYTELSGNSVSQKMYIKNTITPDSAIMVPEGTENVNLTINLLFDNSEFQSMHLQLFDEDFQYTNTLFWQGEPINVNVPSGTYDVVAYFKKGFTIYTVIKELVVVEDDTTLEIDLAEADNKISYDIRNEVGELLRPGVSVNGGPLEGGNAETIVSDRSLYFAPSDYVLMRFTHEWAAMFEGMEPTWNHYINDVSSRYLISESLVASGKTGSFYLPTYESLSNISESVVLENDPESYVFHQEKFQPSNLGQSQQITYPAFETSGFGENRLISGVTLVNINMAYDQQNGIKMYLDNPITNDFLNVTAMPSLADYVTTLISFFGDEPFYTFGNSIVTEGEDILYGSGSIANSWYFLGYDFYYTPEGYEMGNFHPKFSFSNEGQEILQGNNVPALVHAFFDSSQLKLGYKGRFGERRESDFFNTTVEILQNNNTLFTGSYVEFRTLMLPSNGQIKINITNGNNTVDGLEGKNITTLSYNASQNDSPPTLQHLQFRDTDDKVTDRFVAAENGTVRLAAGDFSYDPNTYAFGYEAGNTVELYYSPYIQNNWTQLELTKYPEYFLMPAFGDYYGASLASVVVPQENLWFDVKIICTDASGNKQEQIVSPAFKIEQATMGVEDTNKAFFVIHPNPFTNDLNISLPESVKGNYTFKVSDLSGTTIYYQNQNADAGKSFVWNGSHLPKGIYILSIESKGEIIAKKVIKK